MIIFSSIETNYPANNGIDDSVDALTPFLASHPGISAGDLIQFGAAVGITNCPGAPRLQFLAGRPNASFPASDGTVPGPQDSVDSILARMADGGFTSAELIHLLASHTIARADHVDPTLQAVPFDTTPFTFDTQFFLEVLLKGTGYPGTGGNIGEVKSPLPASGEMRLQSDFALARDSRTACEWQSMVGKRSFQVMHRKSHRNYLDNQQLMMTNFQSSMAKLAVTGQSAATFTDCSEVIPDPEPPVARPAKYPAGKNKRDLQQACSSPFPILSADTGPMTRIPACPDESHGVDCST